MSLFEYFNQALRNPMINETTATATMTFILKREGLCVYKFKSLAFSPLLTNYYLLSILKFETDKNFLFWVGPDSGCWRASYVFLAKNWLITSLLVKMHLNVDDSVSFGIILLAISYSDILPQLIWNISDS